MIKDVQKNEDLKYRVRTNIDSIIFFLRWIGTTHLQNNFVSIMNLFASISKILNFFCFKRFLVASLFIHITKKFY